MMNISVSGDKSITHRAIILASLTNSLVNIRGFLVSEDTMHTVECMRQLGVEIEVKESLNNAIVYGVGKNGLKAPEKPLYTGNSATTMRLLCGLLAGQPFDSVLDGDESLRKRPMGRVITPLALMGANIQSNGDNCPITIKGSKLRGINYRMPLVSAQVKSAIQLASLYANGHTEITDLKEGITRNHTEIIFEHLDFHTTASQEIYIPSDFSSAAYFIAWGLLDFENGLKVNNIGLNPTRTGFIDAIDAMGGHITINRKGYICGEEYGDIFVKKSKLKPITLQGDVAARMIDEIPIFAVMATFTEGQTVIKDAGELAFKESNRLEVMARELNKTSAIVKVTPDGMIIEGKATHDKKAYFDGKEDHWVAMALTVAAVSGFGVISLHEHEVICTSFPKFSETIRRTLLTRKDKGDKD